MPQELGGASRLVSIFRSFLTLGLFSPSLSLSLTSKNPVTQTKTLDLARAALAAGCGQPELRATLRHLVICAGYAGSLAATSALSEAKVRGTFF